MYRHIKRIFDITAALVGIILLSPLFALLAFLVKIESAGSIFFAARRIGKDEKEFNIYKFRTMYEDTPVLPPNKFVDASSYITRTGAMLRRTSLDELPQLLNVLKGEMSFIGPRPGAAKNEEELRLARRRAGVYSALPGITGWAQVNGRDKLAHDVEKKTYYDREYVNNLNFKLDLLIILRTLRVVGSGDGYQEGASGDAPSLELAEIEAPSNRITFRGRVARRLKRDAIRVKSIANVRRPVSRKGSLQMANSAVVKNSRNTEQ